MKKKWVLRHHDLDIWPKVTKFNRVRAIAGSSHLAKTASKSVHPFGWNFVHKKCWTHRHTDTHTDTHTHRHTNCSENISPPRFRVGVKNRTSILWAAGGHWQNKTKRSVGQFLSLTTTRTLTSAILTRLLEHRGHSLSQHTQFLKNNMIAENDFLWNFDTIKRTNTLAFGSLRSRAFYASRSRKFSKKKSVSQLTRNALKRIEMKKKFTPLTHYALRA